MAVAVGKEFYTTTQAAAALGANKLVMMFVSDCVLGQERIDLRPIRALTHGHVEELRNYLDRADPAGEFHGPAPAPRPASNVETLPVSEAPPGDALMTTHDARSALRVNPNILRFVSDCVLGLRRYGVGNAKLFTASQVARVREYLDKVDPSGAHRVQPGPADDVRPG